MEKALRGNMIKLLLLMSRILVVCEDKCQGKSVELIFPLDYFTLPPSLDLAISSPDDKEPMALEDTHSSIVSMHPSPFNQFLSLHSNITLRLLYHGGRLGPKN